MPSATVGTLRVLLSANTAEFETAMAKAGRTVKSTEQELESGFRRIGQQATSAGTILTGALTVPLTALGAGSIKAAMDFETAFANVAKTVDGVADSTGKLTPQGEALAQTFRNLSKEMPATTTELSAIAALGGQMGVPIEQLANFTKHVSALGVAVEGISTEDAAAGLAQIGNISGEGTSKIAEMASALVHLGNNSNATEADILEFTKRLAGAGTTAGMSVPEIMALGTAMANVGLNAEAGGTAMSQVIQKIGVAVSEGGVKLAEFAKVAGMSADQFAAVWQRSPIEAIQAFILGLSTMRDRGVDLNLTMGELGTEGIRISDTLKRMAGDSEGLGRALGIANEGFESANAHLTEAEKKYATTANELRTLWNRVTDLGITLGGALLPVLRDGISVVEKLIPFLEAGANAFAALPEPVRLVAVGIAGLAAAIGPILIALGGLAALLAPLAPLFAALVPTIAAVGAILGSLAVPIAAVVAAVAGLTIVWVKWGDDIKRVTVEAWDGVKSAFSTAIDFIVGLWASFRERIVAGASAAMADVKTWLVDFWEGSILQRLGQLVQAFIDLHVSAFERIRQDAGQFASSMSETWAQWGGEMTRLTSSAWQSISSAFSSGITTIVSAWGSFKERVIAVVSETMQSVKTWLVDYWEGSIFQSVTRMLQALVELFAAIVVRIGQEVAELASVVKHWLVDQLQIVIDGARSVLTTLGGAYVALRDGIVAIVSGLYISVKSWLLDQMQPIVAAVSALIDPIVMAWATAKDAIVSVVSELYTGVKTWLVDQLQTVVAGVQAALTALGDAYRVVRDVVIARVTELYTGVKSWVLDKLQPVFAAVKAAWDPIVNAWTVAKDKIIGIATALFTGVKTWLVDRFTAIVDGIKAKIDAVTQFFKDMKEKVVGNSFVPEMVDAIGVQMARLQEVMVAPARQASEDVQGVFDEMRHDVSATLDVMSSDIQSMFDEMRNGVNERVDAMMTHTTGSFGQMRDRVGITLTDLWNNVKAIFGGGIPQTFQTFTSGPLANLINQIGGALGGTAQRIMSGFQSILSDGFRVASGIARAFAGDFSGIIDAIMAGIRLIQRAWQGLRNWFGGGEEGTQVNPARDQFLLQFGPGGTGPGSGFWNLGLALENAVGPAMAEQLHAALRAADTMAEFNAAVARIQQALGGGGFAPSSGTSFGGDTVGPGEIAPEIAPFIPENFSATRFASGGVELMAEGGFGRVTRPTLFLAGEEGPEDFAFSGSNRSFASGAVPDVTVEVHFNGPVFAEEDYIQTKVVDALTQAIRTNHHSAMTRFKAALEMG